MLMPVEQVVFGYLVTAASNLMEASHKKASTPLLYKIADAATGDMPFNATPVRPAESDMEGKLRSSRVLDRLFRLRL